MPLAFHTPRKINAHLNNHIFDQLDVVKAANNIAPVSQDVLGASLIENNIVVHQRLLQHSVRYALVIFFI